MITYVNTVLVGKGIGEIVSAAPADATALNTASTDAGKYVIMDLGNTTTPYAISENTKKIKIGIVTSKNVAYMKPDGSLAYKPIVKWSNVIDKDSIKSYTSNTWFQSTEDVVKITFTGINSTVLNTLKEGNKRVIVRITYKDLPTRYRKWTESYEYVTKSSDTAETIASAFATIINKQMKRARVKAEAASGVLTLTALPYSDDDQNDSINWANKVRFSVNAYWTDPTAPAFASKNKYALTGVTIEKTPGKWCQTDGKLVRDRESKAMGYEGILNRGQGTWPIIKPDMQTDITKHYDGIVIEFERLYRSADDMFSRTKETLEIYDVTTKLASVKTAIDGWLSPAADEASLGD